MKKIMRFKEIDYVIRYPENFKDNEKYPVIIYLHGAGARGRKIDVVHNHVLFSRTDKFNFDAITIAPQCYEHSWFNIFEQLQEFVEFVICHNFIDKERVYVIGASMGGYATWHLAIARPELFAAIVPICGGGIYGFADRLLHMGVWAFHGGEDNIVRPEESKNMVNAINKRGGSAKLTVYEGVAHNVWNNAFENIDMWNWMFAQKNQYIATKNEYDNVEKFG